LRATYDSVAGRIQLAERLIGGIEAK
jgi:hypothetical protein